MTDFQFIEGGAPLNVRLLSAEPCELPEEPCALLAESLALREVACGWPDVAGFATSTGASVLKERGAQSRV